jgi:peptidoglycan/LPS O-acetylase OafA/YrhL
MNRPPVRAVSTYVAQVHDAPAPRPAVRAPDPGRGFPVNTAPLWAGEFVYGRFAVVVFIAVSGFSLTLGPARSGWRFASLATFAHRRAWRILPPYWAALGSAWS